ncbi:hypothetical protein CUMW_187600 [Citrus unshiu]|uniref:Transcriptional corepressor SEUSS n=1 Tax=Citrus unshiu TaxID=55188 RepID=A0A2H5Q1J9_CITUN|nr:hypothetical protein CUMW_187600 [Citrus unshiu]
MVPPGQAPIGGAQSVSPSLLRSNSGMLGGQGGPLPSQAGFPSLMSPRTQFSNMGMNVLGNVPNVSSLLNQSFGNGVPTSGLSGPGNSQRGGMDTGAETDPLSGVANGMGFSAASSSFVPSNLVNPGSSGQVQGQQFTNPSSNQLPDQQQTQQLETQNFQHVTISASTTTATAAAAAAAKQQQQQQQFLHMSRQSSQAAAAQMNLLQQQRYLQLQQQHQQQQLLKAMPQQRPQLPQHFVQQQNLPLRSPAKPVYEPGMCARRLTHYMYQQQHRPEDNNIEFWRKFVAEYFAPNAKKKWCVSMYGSGRQATGVFPQDVWHCEICNRKPGRGFGICSWEFCARRHEELIPRRLLIPQVSQLGAAAQKYQAATQNASSNLSAPELQNNCNMFVASARQLAKALEVPLVNDLGYTKRYVRCLQISEVVNSMKDLIDYSRVTGTGPMESLAKFPRRTSGASGFHSPSQQPEDQLQQQQQQQQTVGQNSNSESSVQANAMQLATSNGVANVNNSLNPASASSTASTIVGLLHQNSMNSRQQNTVNNASSPYGGSSVQMPSPGSSNNIPQAQPNPSSFQSPTPSSSNNPPQTSHSALTAANHMSSASSPANISVQQPALSGEADPRALSGDADPSDSQSAVQKILHEMMLCSHLNGGSGGGGGMVGVGSLGNDVKNVNDIMATGNNTVLNGGNGLVGNGTVNNNPGIGTGGYGNMGGGLGQSAMVNGIRAAMGNNSMMNGRVGMTAMARDQSMNHQQDLGNQLLNGLGAVNGFNNLQFDWKPSP